MARCYLMIEDNQETDIVFAPDFGLQEGETLPAETDQMTDAQYVTWTLVALLQGVQNRRRYGEIMREASKKILVPGHLA